MTEVFGQLHAALYDTIHGNKSYELECDQIEKIFADFASGSIRSILDIGCGTGNHALELARRGYEVVGVDRSPHMIRRAQEKMAGEGTSLQLRYASADAKDLRVGERFDAVLMMFSVLGYQLTNRDVTAALTSAREHLSPEGLFVFDILSGPTVITQGPRTLATVYDVDDTQVLRFLTSRLDTSTHLLVQDFHLWQLQGERLAAHEQEEHRIRVFFPLELDLFLSCSGLESLHAEVLGEPNREPDDTSWNVLRVARRNVRGHRTEARDP